MTDPELFALWVARETGVLEALLTSADTPEDVAREAGVPERAAGVLTRTLASQGYLERVEGGYEPTNRALGFLTRTDPRSVGSAPHQVDLLERVVALPGALESGESDGAPTSQPEHWTANRLGWVAATEEPAVRAMVTAAVRAVPGAQRVIDVGGAPGTFAAEFARRGYDVTLCAPPETAGRSRAFLASDPVDVVERAIPPVEPLPEADLAFVPDRTYLLSEEENHRLLDSLSAALTPGGTAVTIDRIRDRSPGAPGAAMEALATTQGGDAHPEERYREWFEAAGFEPAVTEVPGTDRQAVVGSLE